MKNNTIIFLKKCQKCYGVNGPPYMSSVLCGRVEPYIAHDLLKYEKKYISSCNDCNPSIIAIIHFFLIRSFLYHA